MSDSSEYSEKKGTKSSAINDSRERDCIKPVVSCFMCSKNFHFIVLFCLVASKAATSPPMENKKTKRRKNTMWMQHNGWEYFFYETEMRGVLFIIIRASVLIFLLCIRIAKMYCVLKRLNSSKFLPMPSLQYDVDGGMSFNSRFSCSQSIRLDVIPDHWSQTQNIAAHIHTRKLRAILFLLLFKWKNAVNC